MQRSTRHRRVSFAVVLFLGIAGCANPENAGRSDADRDIAVGKLRLKSYGLHPAWYSKYTELVEQRLGVEIQGVAGCDVDESLRRSVDGYNRRMREEIDRRFGPAAHEAVEQEAQAGSNAP